MIYDSKGLGINFATDFYNVLNFGVTGDGSTDDTNAINNVTTELAKNGGVIYFPEGIYIVTSSVFFKSNQTLLFENGATLRIRGSYNNIMMNYSTASTGGYDATNNVDIIGATFDGGTSTNNITLFGCCHSQNIRIRNCTFKNAYGYWHNVEINSSKNVLIENCNFEGSRKSYTSGCLVQLDAFDNTSTWPWGNGLVDNTISKYVEIRGCYFHDCSVSPAIGNHSQTADEYVRIHDNVFEGFTNDRGAINFQSYRNVDVYNNTFNQCSIGVTVGTNDGTNTVHDNKFVSVTTVSSGCKEYDNYVNGNIQNPINAGSGIDISNDTVSVNLSNDTYQLLKFENGQLLLQTYDIAYNNDVRTALTEGANYPLASKQYVDEKLSGKLKKQIVTELPIEDIDKDTIYMILRSAPTTNNIYDEYLYVLKSTNPDVYDWELIGSTEVDLSNYYTKTESDNKYQNKITSQNPLSADLLSDGTTNKPSEWNAKVGNTDYATGNVGGVIKTGNRFLVDANSGAPTCQSISYEQYLIEANYKFCAIGTLKNVITGKGLVDSTQLATKQDKLTAGTGIKIRQVAGSNLFNVSTQVNGYLASNGTISPNDDLRTSDYIEMETGKTYTISSNYVNNSHQYFIATYDTDKANGTRIDVSYGTNVGTDFHYLSFTASANGYFRFSYDNNETNVMANEGDTYLPYEPYGEIKNVISTSQYFNCVIVDKNGNGDYTSLTQACSSVANGTVIILNAGVYDNEIAKARDKDLSIIGIDKDKCIIQNDSGAYDDDPLNMTSGYLANVTIKAKAPANYVYDSSVSENYCLHIDASGANKELLVENCNFIAENWACLGIGLHQDQKVTIKNCEMTHLKNDVEGRRLAIAFHESTVTDTTNQVLVLDNCRVRSKAGKTINYQRVGTNSVMELRMYHNTFYDEINGVNCLSGDFSRNGNYLNNTQTLILSGDSTDNNIEDFNIISYEKETTISTDTTSTTVSLTLADNHEYRYTQDLTSLTLTMPSGDFISSIVFASGSTPTSMTYDSSIKWSGDDVTNGQFVPSADKDYDIMMYYNGLNINGIVRGA